jgi:hypothetical protein
MPHRVHLPPLPGHPDKHRTVASVQPPGVVLIEIVLSEPPQQTDELLPFGCGQAFVHMVHNARTPGLVRRTQRGEAGQPEH